MEGLVHGLLSSAHAWSVILAGKVVVVAIGILLRVSELSYKILEVPRSIKITRNCINNINNNKQKK